MKKKNYKEKEIKNFLKESNAIEEVYDEQSLKDAIRAWDYIKAKQFLTPEVILGTHHFLMRNLRSDIAGFWRTCDVWIGGHKKHFISVQLIEEDVKKVLDSINLFIKTLPSNATKEYKEETCKQHHIQLEFVHGFEDGNGRIFRLVWLWERLKVGLPINIIHADWPKIDGEQQEYYGWFKK
jgi:Fic family protein